MMALETDFISPAYNSFFTEEELDTYIDMLSPLSGGDGGWGEFDSAQKEPYIFGSVRFINKQPWMGSKHSGIVVPQMQWPRTGLTYRDGSAVDPDSTPDEIGLSSACWILGILNGIFSAGGSGSGPAIGAVKKKVVGKVSIEYETGGGGGAGSVEIDPELECITRHVSPGWVAALSSGGIGTVGTQRMP